MRSMIGSMATLTRKIWNPSSANTTTLHRQLNAWLSSADWTLMPMLVFRNVNLLKVCGQSSLLIKLWNARKCEKEPVRMGKEATWAFVTPWASRVASSSCSRIARSMMSERLQWTDSKVKRAWRRVRRPSRHECQSYPTSPQLCRRVTARKSSRWSTGSQGKAQASHFRVNRCTI